MKNLFIAILFTTLFVSVENASSEQVDVLDISVEEYELILDELLFEGGEHQDEKKTCKGKAGWVWLLGRMTGVDENGKKCEVTFKVPTGWYEIYVTAAQSDKEVVLVYSEKPEFKIHSLKFVDDGGTEH